MNKNQHGGPNRNQGRKPSEPTKTIRVPVVLISAIEKLVKKHKSPKTGIDK